MSHFLPNQSTLTKFETNLFLFILVFHIVCTRVKLCNPPTHQPGAHLLSQLVTRSKHQLRYRMWFYFSNKSGDNSDGSTQRLEPDGTEQSVPDNKQVNQEAQRDIRPAIAHLITDGRVARVQEPGVLNNHVSDEGPLEIVSRRFGEGG